MKSSRAWISIAVVVVALACLGVFGVATWWDVFGTEARTASTRDDVASVASTKIAVLASLDYRRAEQDLGGWANASTGALKSKLDGSRKSDAKQATKTKSISTARIGSVSVTRLDTEEGSAEVIAAGKLRIAAEGKPAVTRRAGFTAQLRETDHGWKVSDLASTGTGPS